MKKTEETKMEGQMWQLINSERKKRKEVNEGIKMRE